MRPGDQVEWTNGSYILETRNCGEIVHVCGEHAVVFSPRTARSHPHISPYVSKRVAELRPIRDALAA